MASFYQADGAIFNQCDDSSGNIGDIFRIVAKQLFVSHAVQCPDKKWLSEWVFELNREDDYGIRDIIVDCAAEYLPEPMIRHLIERFQIAAGKETDEYKKQHWLLLLESLARQIKDAPLFEKARIAARGTLSTAARVYFESGDVNSAFFNYLLLFLNIFLMPILFFIAGFFALPSLCARGVSGFIKAKFIRLGIPLLLGVLFFKPIENFIFYYSRDLESHDILHWFTIKKGLLFPV